MKIIALQAENIKKLVVVHINPKGNIVEITGKNGQGKTSVLDSIWWALGGTANVQKSPIRKGQKEASIKLNLGEIVVTRTFKLNDEGELTSSLRVENSEGARFGSPQAMLDKLLGDLTFDPLAFARADAKTQFNTLRKFVPEVDFDQLDSLNRGDFEKRTEENRQAKLSRSAAGVITVADGPMEKANLDVLTEELLSATRHNSEIEARKERRKNVASDIARLVVEEEELRGEAQALIERANQKGKSWKELQAKLDAAETLPAPIDYEAIRNKVSEVQALNEDVDKRVRKAEFLKVAEKHETAAQAITTRMENREIDKRLAIEKAKLPVPGLGFGEGLVLLNGVPFDQSSDAEQLRASIGIAMALNPKLRVIRVRDGSLLDEASMKLLAEMADEHDTQVWVERVDGSGKVGFVLEDGHVRESVAA